jgi:hypothetical protein
MGLGFLPELIIQPFPSPTLLRDLCVICHSECSEAIQKTSGSPRRFVTRDDNSVGFGLSKYIQSHYSSSYERLSSIRGKV